MPIIPRELKNEFDFQLQNIQSLWDQRSDLCHQLDNAPKGFNKLNNTNPPEFSFYFGPGGLLTVLALMIGWVVVCFYTPYQDERLSNFTIVLLVVLGLSFIFRTFFKERYDESIEKWQQLKPKYDSITKTIHVKYDKIRNFISNLYRWIKATREQVDLDGVQLRRLSYYHNQYIMPNSKYDSAWIIGLFKIYNILCNEENTDRTLKEHIYFPQGGISKPLDDLGIDKSIEIQEEKRLTNHIAFEGRISNFDKNRLKQLLGYDCMACGINMAEKYGEPGYNYIELHHKVPYSQMKENDTRTLCASDFCVLCPNCHRMIHKLADAGDLETLQDIVNHNK